MSQKFDNEKVYLLDGGFASQLISEGFTYVDEDPLWSARLLITNHDAVIGAHRSFLRSGVDILETNTYQVSVDNFATHANLSELETRGIIRDSVASICKPVCDEWLKSHGKKIYIAGSVGPYGACQHDGSEYNGHYVDRMTEKQLADWHRPRMKLLFRGLSPHQSSTENLDPFLHNDSYYIADKACVEETLAESGVDIFAMETIPAQKEADTLVSLLEEEFPDMSAWVAFSCKDGRHTNHGETLHDAVEKAAYCRQITHIGVNCTHPSFVGDLLDSIEDYRSRKPFIVYANSGEVWNSSTGWSGTSQIPDAVEYVNMCVDKGATIIGGCCRMLSTHIQQFRDAINKRAEAKP